MIYVIAHKKFDDSFLDKKHYQVLHVGKDQDSNEDSIRDDVGENISEKNPFYCELTGLYWIWKNGPEKPDDIVGLVHYRRFFTTFLEDLKYVYFNRRPAILNIERITRALDKHDILMPKRTFIFRTVRTFYNAHHIPEDLDIARQVIEELYPESLDSFDDVMSSHKFYYGNMLVCKKKLLDEYAKWLFDILFAMEGKIDMGRHITVYQQRIFGFLSERLLQVWVVQKELKVKEFPVFNVENKRMNFFQTNKKRLVHLLNRRNERRIRWNAPYFKKR